MLSEIVPGAGQSNRYEADDPLPSYDLEEVGAEQALSRSGPSPRVELTVDDPFGDEPGAAEAPLPSFPLGAPEENRASVLDEDEIIMDDALDAPSSAKSSTPGPSPADIEMLEGVLDEAEFFIARGLYDDAKTILAEQLGRTPNHPLVLERLREVEEAMAAAGAGSQTIELSMLGDARPQTVENAMSASLDALDDMEPPPESVAAVSAVGANVHSLDVDQVFAKFKAGVRAQVSETDSATNYDLGVAYKEMGMIKEALNAFQIAARDPHRECMCFAMIGIIYLEQNRLDEAAEAYVQALASTDKTVEQEMSLYYDLGTVYEMKGKEQDALYYFQKIARRDPGYRDTADRVNTLSPNADMPVKQPSARAVNDDDDFDRVFDDLFDSK
jgi:tetratricopeptide (TPR) repeat protein